MLSDREINACLAGASAGIATTAVCSPLDVAKIRAQATRRAPRAPYDAVKSIWKAEGFRGLFLGLSPALLTVPIFWATYFPLYERTKRAVSSSSVLSDVPSWAQHCISAVATGAVADCLTNPFWVIRTRMQLGSLKEPLTHGKRDVLGVVGTAKKIFVHEGPLAFYKGLSATLLGLTHVAVQFPVYEWLKREARVRSSDQQETLWDLVFASAASKFVGSSVTYPHEVVRTRLQAAEGRDSPGLVRTLRIIVGEAGITGLYAGFGLNLVRVVPACVLTFVIYENIVSWLNRRHNAPPSYREDGTT